MNAKLNTVAAVAHPVEPGAAPPLTVVYIMGYGRSGSTILDILLQQHPDVVSAGALNNLYNWRLRNELCGCAAPVSECRFWTAVLQRFVNVDAPPTMRAMRRLEASIESVAAYPPLLCGLHSQRRLADYGRQIEQLFASIAEVSGRRFVVDSSKSARDCTGRPLALVRHTALKVKVIYLVRDGRGVAWSVMRRTGSDERRRRWDYPTVNFARAMLGWTATNALALVTQSRLTDQAVLRVTYEDLCDRPDERLRDIGAFIGLDMEPVIGKIAAGGELAVGHNLGGNRVRFTRHGLRFQPDYEWIEKMPLLYRRAFEAASWPVSAALGYARRPAA